MYGIEAYTRVLVVALGEDRAAELTRILERNGCMVTSTTGVTAALDLAGYSDFQAVVVAEDIPLAERGYIRSQLAQTQPSAVFVSNRSSRSVMLQLSQAFKEARSAG